jgi:xanthine dehydrogenase accessory factor
MNSYLDALQTLQTDTSAWIQVTVVKTIGSVPCETGCKMLVTENGLFFGTVGGGKLENKALDLALLILVEQQPPQLLTWHLQQDVGMTCGGTVTLFFEVFQKKEWPIVIFGAGHVAQALVRTLLPLNAHIQVIDSRLEWLQKFPPAGPDKLQLTHLETLSLASAPNKSVLASLKPNAFVVVMTMGHATDLPILKALSDLEMLMESDLGIGQAFPYIGVIGSEAKAIRLKADLHQQGVSNAFTERLICPIGLPLGSNQPAEIAISIVAQLLQERDRLAAAGDARALARDSESVVQA